MKIVNLNKHPLTLEVKGEVITIPASGSIAEVAESYEPQQVSLGGMLEGAVVVRRKRGEIKGVPAPEPGTIYLVNGLVLAALAGSGRADVFAPDSGPTAVRYPAGHERAGQIAHITRLVACD